MIAVKMHHPHLKLYTVPHTLQPMEGLPLTMSGVGMAKGQEEPTVNGVTTKASNTQEKSKSKDKPMTLYYMQRPQGTMGRPEHIGLSMLNIAGKPPLQHPTLPTEIAGKSGKGILHPKYSN